MIAVFLVHSGCFQQTRIITIDVLAHNMTTTRKTQKTMISKYIFKQLAKGTLKKCNNVHLYSLLRILTKVTLKCSDMCKKVSACSLWRMALHKMILWWSDKQKRALLGDNEKCRKICGDANKRVLLWWATHKKDGWQLCLVPNLCQDGNLWSLFKVHPQIPFVPHPLHKEEERKRQAGDQKRTNLIRTQNNDNGLMPTNNETDNNRYLHT